MLCKSNCSECQNKNNLMFKTCTELVIQRILSCHIEGHWPIHLIWPRTLLLPKWKLFPKWGQNFRIDPFSTKIAHFWNFYYWRGHKKMPNHCFFFLFGSFIGKCAIYGQMCHLWANTYAIYWQVPFLGTCVTYGQMCHLWANVPFIDKYVIYDKYAIYG